MPQPKKPAQLAPKKPTPAKTKAAHLATLVETLRHKDKHVNISIEELRGFVAEGMSSCRL